MSEQITLRAVLKEAERLRRVASSQKIKDPYAELYAPTEAAARKLCQRKANELALALPVTATDDEVSEARAKGPEAAIAELRWRAAQKDRLYRESKIEDAHRRERHIRRQREARKEKDIMRRHLTPLQRIATALAQLEVVGAGPATSFDARVTGSKDHSGPMFPGDPTARGREIALRAARELEEEVESARRRRIETEGKAA